MKRENAAEKQAESTEQQSGPQTVRSGSVRLVPAAGTPVPPLPPHLQECLPAVVAGVCVGFGLLLKPSLAAPGPGLVSLEVKLQTLCGLKPFATQAAGWLRLMQVDFDVPE